MKVLKILPLLVLAPVLWAGNSGTMIFKNQSGIELEKISAEKTVTLQLTENKWNTSSDKADEVDVLITSSFEPNGETLTLIETGPNTNVFIAEIFIGLGEDEALVNGILEVHGGDDIVVRTAGSDITGGFGNNILYRTTTTVTGTVSLTDASGAEVLSYDEGSTVYIRVDDMDRDEDDAAVDTVSVRISSQSDTTGLVVVLNETGNNTGIFTDSISTSTTSGTSTLLVTRGDKLTATYNDPADDFGNAATITDVAFYAVTLKSGAITADATWSDDDSPFLVTGDVTVNSGVTLTIEPGVEVRFTELSDDQTGGNDINRGEIIIDGGSLIAQGTAADSIWFTSNAEAPAKSDWYGISVKNDVGVILMDYVSLAYANYGFRFQDWTNFYGNQGDSMVVANSHIRDISSYIFYRVFSLQNGATMRIEDNTFTDFSGVLDNFYLYHSSTLLILKGNSFIDNTGGILNYVSFQQAGPRVEVRDNVQTSGSSSMNVNVSYSSGTLPDYDVIVEGNQLKGGQIYFYGNNAAYGRFLVEGNTFDGSYLQVYYANKALIKDNVIKNSTEGDGALQLRYSNAVVEGDSIINNRYNGIYLYTDFNYLAVKDTIRNCVITGNNQNNSSSKAGININEYANPVISNNDLHSNNYYDIRNNSEINEIDARYNWWEATTTTEMATGANPKNITKIYDYYDDASKTFVNYAQWLEGPIDLSDTTSPSYSGPTWHVSTSGSNSSGNGSAEYPFASIQTAIDSSTSGDTILVSEGTYVENINFNGKNISVIGADRETTIIDGNQSGSVVTFESGEDSTAVLSGFTITNGSGDFGADSAPWGSDSHRYGGGIFCINSNPLITEVLVTLNSAELGGGIVIGNNSAATIKNTVITSNNTTWGQGGGLLCYSSNPFFQNIEFINNQSATAGSAMFISTQSAPIFNNILVNNNITEYDVSISISDNATADFINCTIIGNNLGGGNYPDHGNAIHIEGGYSTIINSIIRLASGIISIYGNAEVNYSNVMGGWEGEGNIDSDPLFCDADSSDFTLYDNSPCVGTGQAGYNMGAYGIGCEAYSGPTWHVSTTGSDSYDGSDEFPFATIQKGIDESSSGDTVLVAAGTYTENINFNGKNIAVVGEDSSNTIIDGNQSGSVVTFETGEDSTALLSGFTIQNGSGTLDTTWGAWYYGGGIYISATVGPTIRNVIIANNYAIGSGIDANHYGEGGGIYARSSFSLSNSVVTNNTADYSGGISVSSWNKVYITNVTISGNTANRSHGGISLGGSDHVLRNCIISDNTSLIWGAGGIVVSNSSPVFYNCLIKNNNAQQYGGAVVATNTPGPIFVNCTFVENTTDMREADIHLNVSEATFINCILWDPGTEQLSFNGTHPHTATFVNSLVRGGIEPIESLENYPYYTINWDSAGNIDADPFFADSENGDYSLLDNSPAIGAGIDSVTIDGVTYTSPIRDLTGNARPMPAWTMPDMGAYENETGLVVVPGGNYSLSFDGVDDYVNLGDILNNLYQPVTFEISAKFNDNGGTLFSTDNCGVEDCNYNGYWLDIDSTQISIAYGDGEWHGGGERRTGKANVSLSPGEWYSIAAIVRGPQDMSIYLDGDNLEMNYQDAGTGGTVNFTSDPFRIGSRDNNYFDGLMDELRVWDVELSSSEIQSNYNTTLTGNETGLIGYWNFNEGTGTTLTDQTSNGNDGTINGATWSTDVPDMGSYEHQNIPIDIYAPTGLTWDGNNYWVPGGWATATGSLLHIFKLDPETGAKVDSIPSVSGWPGGITWDGVALWVLDYLGGPKLIAVSPEDGSVNSSVSARYTSMWGGVATDGYYLYYGINGNNNAIYKVDPATGAHVDSLDMTGYNINGMAWDGSALWLSDSYADSLYRMTMDGTLLDAWPSPGPEPAGLTIVNGKLMNLDRSDNIIYVVDTVEIVAGQPNLRVQSFDSPHHVQPGELIGDSVYLVIVNDGNADADSFNVGFYISEDSIITTDDVLLNGGREFVEYIGAGDTLSVDLAYQASVPNDLEPGLYYFGPIVDEFDVVEEYNEYDNVWRHFMRIGDPEFSLSFDGDGDYVNFGDPADSSLDFGSDPFSYTIWAKTMTTDFQQIVCKRGEGGSYEMQMSGGFVTADYVNASTMISNGEWHHLAYTWSGDSAKLYIDGALESVGAPEDGETFSASSDGVLHIGADTYQGEWFTGNLDDFRMWNRELEASEIVPNMYFHPNWDDDLRPVGYWPFHEGGGDVVHSWAEQELLGQIFGADWSDDVPDKPDGIAEVSITAALPDSGYIWVGLWFPGSDYENRGPDIGRDSVYVNFADSSEHTVHFTGLPEGDGYVVRSIFDVIGSQTGGTDECDEGEDLWGETDPFSIGEQTSYVNLVLEECVGPNSPPYWTGLPSDASYFEDDTLALDFSDYAFDDDDPIDSLSFHVLWSTDTLDNMHWNIIPGTTLIEFYADPDSAGFSESYVFFTQDPEGLGARSDTITISVFPVEDAPVITSGGFYEISEETYFSYQAEGHDADDDSLSWNFTNLPAWLDTDADSVFGTPTEGGTADTFWVHVSDGILTDSLDVTVSVLEFNSQPIVGLDLDIREHHNIVPFDFSMLDLEDDSMTYSFYYSTDSLEWTDATVSEAPPARPVGSTPGAGKYNSAISLGNSPRARTDFEMEWDSRTDLGDTHAFDVWFKASVTDGSLTTTKTTESFSVDNYIGSVWFDSYPTGEVAGILNMSYTLSDPTNDAYTMTLQYSTDGGSSWMEPTLNNPISDPLLPSEYIGTLTWNTETDLANSDEQVLLGLSITDGWEFGFADTIEFTVDNQELISLVSYSPDTSALLNWYDTFVLFFPGEVDEATLESGITLEGSITGTVSASYNIFNTGSQVRLSLIPDETFYSGETVTLTISTDVTDTLGNPFDGNMNGDVDGDLDITVLEYEAALLGDYNYSGLVQFNDLLDFQQAWWNPSTFGGRETGPAEGSAPNLKIQSDGAIDFEDLMVFVQMWNWSAGFVRNDGWIANARTTGESGIFIETTFPKKQVGSDIESLYLNILVDSLTQVGAGEVLISYDPFSLEFKKASASQNKNWIVLASAAEPGLLTINLADFNTELPVGTALATIEFRTLQDIETSISWQADLRTRSGEIWGQGSGQTEFSTVPDVPMVFALHQNYPNPFNPTTTIQYDLPEDSRVRLTVYDIQGRVVAVISDGVQPAGFRSVIWNGRDVRGLPAAAGIYFLRLDTPSFHDTRKMILLK